MATRVKKLAKQLERPPVEVLGLLHAMGYVRYKSAQDMVADDVIERLRREMRDGLRPLDLEVRRVPSKTDSSPAAPPPVATPAKVMAAAPSVTNEEADQLRAELTRTLSQRDEALETVESLRESVQRLRAELTAVQAARDEIQATLDSHSPEAAPADTAADGDVLVAALQARGLRGDDEYERALGALAGKRVLRELLSLLTVRDAAAVGRVLDRRLLLVGDAIDEEITGGAAVVAVAAERAEVPGTAQLERAVGRVGEQCLLSGLRRITVVGLPPLWHRLLNVGLDPRVELRIAHGVERTPEQARADLDGADGVVLLGVEVSAEAALVYAAAGVWVHRSNAADFSSFLDGWVVGLRED